jgi:hypothetical protein
LRYREPSLPWICTVKGALIDYTLIIGLSNATSEIVESAHIGQTLGLKALPARKSASCITKDPMRYLLMIEA